MSLFQISLSKRAAGKGLVNFPSVTSIPAFHILGNRSKTDIVRNKTHPINFFPYYMDNTPYIYDNIYFLKIQFLSHCVFYKFHINAEKNSRTSFLILLFFHSLLYVRLFYDFYVFKFFNHSGIFFSVFYSTSLNTDAG